MNTFQSVAGPGPLKYTPSASIDSTFHVSPEGTTKSSARSELEPGKSVNVADKVALAVSKARRCAMMRATRAAPASSEIEKMPRFR